MFDVERILRAVKEIRPDTVCIFACGSALRRSGPVVTDLDLVLLATDQGLTSIGDECVVINDNAVSLTVYNPAYFNSLAQDAELFFLGLREVRKLLYGSVIFDPCNIGRDTLARLKNVEVAPELVTPVLDSSRSLWRSRGRSEVFSIEHHRAIDLLVFSRFHIRRDIYYSKHKYLFEDAAHLNSRIFSDFLHAIVRATLDGCDLWTCISWLERVIEQVDVQIKSRVSRVLGDARHLLSLGKFADAVFPARYVAIVFAGEGKSPGCNERTALPNVTDGGDVLLLGRKLPAEIEKLYDLCLQEAYRLLGAD